MPENLNPEHQLEALKELRRKYEEALQDAEKSGDYREAEKLKEELEARLSALEAQFPKPEAKPEVIENEEFNEHEFEKRSINCLRDYLSRELITPAGVLSSLTCMGSEEAMDLRALAYSLHSSRRKNNKSTVVADSLMAKSYTGVDTEKSWQFRDNHMNIMGTFQSLAGLDSDRAWKLRDQLGGTAPLVMLKSLTGLDSEKAWSTRNIVLNNGNGELTLRCGLLNSLAGLNSERAWKFRDAIKIDFETTAILEALAISLTGIDTDRAWRIRQAIELEVTISVTDDVAKKTIFPALAKSIAGIDSEKAWRLRSRLEEEDLVFSLAGLNTDLAWDARDDFFKNVNIEIVSNSLMQGLNGDPTTAIGWRTARKYQKEKE